LTPSSRAGNNAAMIHSHAMVVRRCRWLHLMQLAGARAQAKTE